MARIIFSLIFCITFSALEYFCTLFIHQVNHYSVTIVSDAFEVIGSIIPYAHSAELLRHDNDKREEGKERRVRSAINQPSKFSCAYIDESCRSIETDHEICSTVVKKALALNDGWNSFKTYSEVENWCSQISQASNRCTLLREDLGCDKPLARS